LSRKETSPVLRRGTELAATEKKRWRTKANYQSGPARSAKRASVGERSGKEIGIASCTAASDVVV